MRARWESLHAALIRSVTSLPAAEQFQRLRRSETFLARFDSAEALLAYLVGNDAKLDDRGLDDKDQIYAALVRTVQIRAPAARVAADLAWCGLWPGLDRIYRRRLRRFNDDPDELTQAIWLAFTELVNRLDLAQVRRVAATLVRSTERDVLTARRRTASGSATAMANPVDATVIEERVSPWVANDQARPSRSFAGELVELRAQLVPLLGADADLVIAVLILEVDQHEAAARMGLTYTAARKRVQRAVLRMRAQLRPVGGPDVFGQSLAPLVNRPVPETGDDNE